MVQSNKFLGILNNLLLQSNGKEDAASSSKGPLIR